MTEDEAVKTVGLDEIREAKKPLSRGESLLLLDEKSHPIALLRPVGWPDESIPLPERRRQFLRRSASIRRTLKAQGVTEQQIDRDVEAVLRRRR